MGELGDGAWISGGEAVPRQFLIVPSLSCPARCSYCFGPRSGPQMSLNTLSQTLDHIQQTASEGGNARIRIIFHGGEPLTAGHGFFEKALDGIRLRFGAMVEEISVQSNLWLLDDGYARLFKEHRVGLSTSLDGPEEITDTQRCRGYFDRTMKGIRLAQNHGISPGCVATFTPRSLSSWGGIFNFFLSMRLDFSVHAAVPKLDGVPTPDALSPGDYGRLLCEMLDHYAAHRRQVSIATLNQVCRSLAALESSVCTFRACLGMFLAYDPLGNIYPCQRLGGRPDYCLGTVQQSPSWTDLKKSPMAQRMAARQQRVDEECGDCPHFSYCRGGCPYNAWSSNSNGHARDPYCDAYKQIFSHAQKRLLMEMSSEDNISAIAEKPWRGTGQPLLRKGPLIELSRSGPHPKETARATARIVAAVELARHDGELQTAAGRLVAMGIARNLDTALLSLHDLRKNLLPRNRRNNLYLHVTFSCRLRCRHCYVGEPPSRRDEIGTATFASLISQAGDVGFRQVIITGGEPLEHSERDAMLVALQKANGSRKCPKLVLRTNLTVPLSEDELRQIAGAFDQVVVSIDGDQAGHDARRGEGAYQACVRNMEAYQHLSRGLPGAAELSIAAVLRAKEIQGPSGFAVRELARGLGVRRCRFRPLLPLGRAAEWDEPPTSEALGAYLDPMEMIENGFFPIASCGMGQNLYVEPGGESFPCYAYHEPHSFLGNVIQEGLRAVVGGSGFTDLSRHTVDTNPKCARCDVRYLCGGACRAWGGSSTGLNLDAPPPECDGLKSRAQGLLDAARNYLEISTE